MSTFEELIAFLERKKVNTGRLKGYYRLMLDAVAKKKQLLEAEKVDWEEEDNQRIARSCSQDRICGSVELMRDMGMIDMETELAIEKELSQICST